MNKRERRILFGLYQHREMVGEAIPYSAGELNWLGSVRIPKGRNWLRGDRLQSLESAADSYLESIGATSAAAEQSLSYLQAMGYLTNTKEHGSFRIAVTGRGAEVARELGSCIGRLNYVYKRHKDGVLWFIATVLVSVITTLATHFGFALK